MSRDSCELCPETRHRRQLWAPEPHGFGRYVLENDEHVNVLVARSVPTIDGVTVAFADVWSRRRSIELAPGVLVQVPTIDDLILTKRFGARAKDLEDIRLLNVLKLEESQ